MQDMIERKEKFVGLPFYGFITVLIGSFGVVGFLSFWRDGQAFYAILTFLLAALHIGFYWLNLKRYYTTRWWVFYYAIQTVLILGITLLPYPPEGHDGVSFFGSAIITIIAEAFGVWGNTRRTFFLGLFYAGVLIGGFMLMVEYDLVWVHLSQLLLNGSFIILIMYVFNLQLKERQKAEELAETLESANAKLAAYAAHNETLTLQAERERMARELHDTLAQGVAGLVLQLEAIKAHQEQENHPQAKAVLAQATERARNTLKESRAAIEDLRNDEVDFQQTIEKMVEQFSAASKTKFDLNLQLNLEIPLPQHIQHHARRVLYEGLTNI